ncbi:hypothetical protein TIFTF001_026514 [Ficus carica]|uniref:Uncharacterized protein n=1 Tax=Ficus carica TaxID=3494 RepID=A0AA88IWZ5_FICCA|nr:hypothetical protein TIFTF001_026514 [Ficus carica]
MWVGEVTGVGKGGLITEGDWIASVGEGRGRQGFAGIGGRDWVADV